MPKSCCAWRSRRAQELPADESPRTGARGWMSRRRTTGRGRSHEGLADLGQGLLEGDTRRAAATLAEARAGARGLGNPVLEADVMSNLALVACYAGQPEQGRGLITPVLDYARAVGDRYAEKLALDRLLPGARLGDHAGALAPLKAVALAVTLDDRNAEADIFLEVRYRACRAGRERAARRWRNSRRAATDPGQSHGGLVRSSPGELPLRRPWPLGQPLPWFDAGRSIAAGTGRPARAAGRPRRRPGATGLACSGMALTAAKSMAAFSSAPVRCTARVPRAFRLRSARLRLYYTGLRCRICGCITAAKARIHHERCPAGRWPT